MEFQDSSAAIYSEAKSEYTGQLVFNFQPTLLRFFLDRFAEVKTLPNVTSKTKSALSAFQDSLSQIPEWNLDKVHSETTRLLEAIQCDYIEDLITAVFIAHTKILSAIRLHSKPRRKINITVPKADHFMHRTMSECSRFLWSNVYLFDDTVSSVDRQKNMNEVNRLLENGILQAIRNLLPVKSILRDSLQEDDSEAIQVNMQDNDTSEHMTPEPDTYNKMETETVKLPEDKDDIVDKTTEDNSTIKTLEVSKTSKVVEVTKNPETLVIDTERTVGFTGLDSVYGLSGEAEMKQTTDEDENDDLKIIGGLEELDTDEIEDLDSSSTPTSNLPLSADDYETL
ncbi:MAG: hypothetical protein EB127_20220 [Alphaproteobacteria bacterium]|nr:hypothetical protein [Alphaproteobacteria bacterium]